MAFSVKIRLKAGAPTGRVTPTIVARARRDGMARGVRGILGQDITDEFLATGGKTDEMVYWRGKNGEIRFVRNQAIVKSFDNVDVVRKIFPGSRFSVRAIVRRGKTEYEFDFTECSPQSRSGGEPSGGLVTSRSRTPIINEIAEAAVRNVVLGPDERTANSYPELSSSDDTRRFAVVFIATGEIIQRFFYRDNAVIAIGNDSRYEVREVL